MCKYGEFIANYGKKRGNIWYNLILEMAYLRHLVRFGMRWEAKFKNFCQVYYNIY
jgi:hypothetical protein